MKTKIYKISKISVTAAFLALALLCSCFVFGIAAARADDSQEDGSHVLKLGEEVRDYALYADELSIGSVEFSASATVANGGLVLIGLMRDADAYPAEDYGERGLIFAVSAREDRLFLNVTGVELRSTVKYVEDLEIESGGFSVKLVRMSRGYTLYVNGTRIVRDYSDALQSLGVTSFSSGGKTHLAVAVYGDDSSVIVERAESGDGQTAATAEWFGKDHCAATGSDRAVQLDNGAMRLSEAQNVAYTRVNISLATGNGDKTYIAFAPSAGVPLFTLDEAGASGVALCFRTTASGIFLDVEQHDGGERIELLTNLLLSAKTELSVELKKKNTLLGYTLSVDGVRITVSGKDVLDAVAKEDVGRFENASFTGTYVSAGSSGRASVLGVSQADHDPQPVLNEKDIVNESVYGAKESDWSGDFAVENGVMRSYSSVYLKQALDVDYVGFELGFAALADSNVISSSVTFGLSSEPNASGNSVYFVLSMRNYTVYIAGYSLYDGELKNFLPAKALDGVQVQDEMKVEFVYYDYDLALYINGNMLRTSYGSNPLDEYFSLYYENEDYLTYLYFNAYAYADAQKPTLSAQNCANYRVYSVSNDMPEHYIGVKAPVTKPTTAQEEKFEIHKVLVPCAVAFAVSAAAGATVVVLYAKRRAVKQ